MSIYRKLLIAAATMVLSSYVFAADDAATTTTTSTETQTTEAAAPVEAQPAATTTTESSSSTTTTVDKVDLNKASVKDLMKLKGLNSAKAKAIVTYRKKHGDFKSVNDLKSVKGFKKMHEDKMKEVQDQLMVD